MENILQFKGLFLSNVIVKDEISCWIWTGYLDRKGYGIFLPIKYRPPIRAHIFSFEVFKGERNGNDVHHTCNNTSCVNPAHLELLPHNTHGIKTHCKNGHPFTEENTYLGIRPDGRTYKRCRKCGRIKKALKEGRNPNVIRGRLWVQK